MVDITPVYQEAFKQAALSGIGVTIAGAASSYREPVTAAAVAVAAICAAVGLTIFSHIKGEDVGREHKDFALRNIVQAASVGVYAIFFRDYFTEQQTLGVAIPGILGVAVVWKATEMVFSFIWARSFS